MTEEQKVALDSVIIPMIEARLESFIAAWLMSPTQPPGGAFERFILGEDD